MAFQAALAFVAVRPLLHVLELNRAGATVVLGGGRTTGRLAVLEGRLVDARYDTDSGPGALAGLLATGEGWLRLEPFAEPPGRSLPESNAAVLGAIPVTPAPSSPTGRIEGDGAGFGLGELLELLLFAGTTARVTLEGGEVAVARGTLVGARAGQRHGEDALFTLLERGPTPFAAVPAADLTETPERPLAAALAAVFARLSDARFLRRKGEDDGWRRQKSLLEDLAGGAMTTAVRAMLARRVGSDLEPTPTPWLGRLCLDPDDAVRAAAKETVESLESEVLEALLADPTTPAPLVSHLIEVFHVDADLLAAAAMNPGLEEEAAVRLAQLADVTVAEALLRSKWSTSGTVRAALGRDSATQRSAGERTTPAAAALEDPLGHAAGRGRAPQGGARVAKRVSLSSLSLREQVFLAGAGNQRQQLNLVCSPTPGVACAVVVSPKMNESMAMSIAGLTVANSEALRDLAQTKRYSLQYPIARTLAFNPKCPPQAVLDLLPRLKDNDLKSLARVGGLAEVVKAAVQRLLHQREEKRRIR